MTRRSAALALTASLAFTGALAGCGKAEVTQPSGTILPPTAKGKPCVEQVATPPATTPPTTAAPEGSTPPGSDAPTTTTTVAVPKVSVPVGPPPAEVVKTDIKVGEGMEATADTQVSFNYVGVACSTGETFDESFSKGQPLEIQPSNLVPGMSEGLAGMKPGGQRLIVIPPDKGYGDRPQAGSKILPGETLIFYVEMVKVDLPPTTTTAAPGPGATTTTTAPGTPAPGADVTTTTAAGATTTAAPSTTAGTAAR